HLISHWLQSDIIISMPEFTYELTDKYFIVAKTLFLHRIITAAECHAPSEVVRCTLELPETYGVSPMRL
ncbi:MAG: hypothetical protein WBK46_07725, partial [Ruminococcus flavefaciens]